MHNHSSTKSGVNLPIVIFSLICSVSVIGISAALISEVGSSKSAEQNESTNSINSSGKTSGNNNALVTVLIIGIVAVSFQLLTSIVLWCTREKKDSKSVVIGYACGQAIIQIILLICLGFVIYQYYKPIKKDVMTSASSQSATGHGFWIILSGNVIFHIIAISYLCNLVMKRSDQDDLEEMTAVVVHRRVPSRIPKTKRHGGYH